MNHQESHLRFSTETAHETIQAVPFGVVSRPNGHRSCRVEIHVGHPSVELYDTAQPNEEVRIDYDPEMGPYARSGYLSDVAIKLMEVIAQTAKQPYNEYIGIRVSDSQVDGYTMRIVCRVDSATDIDALCDSMAAAVTPDGSKAVIHDDIPIRTSDEEIKAWRDYQLLDID